MEEMNERGGRRAREKGWAGWAFVFFVVLQEPQKLTKEVARDL